MGNEFQEVFGKRKGSGNEFLKEEDFDPMINPGRCY